MADVEKAIAEIKKLLEPKQRASGRKVDVNFHDSTLKLVDSSSKWVLRAPDGSEMTKSVSGLKAALESFAGMVTPKAASGDGCQFCGRTVANAGALSRHERACGVNPANQGDDDEEEPGVGKLVMVAAALTEDQVSAVDKAMATVGSAWELSTKELPIDVGDTVVRVLLSRDSLGSAFDITIENGEGEEDALREELGSEMAAGEVRVRVERLVQSSNEWSESTMKILELLEGGGLRVRASSASDGDDSNSATLDFRADDRGFLWELAEGEAENGEAEDGEEEDEEEGEEEGEVRSTEHADQYANANPATDVTGVVVLLLLTGGVPDTVGG